MKISWNAKMFNLSNDEVNLVIVEVETREDHVVINETLKGSALMNLSFRIPYFDVANEDT